MSKFISFKYECRVEILRMSAENYANPNSRLIIPKKKNENERRILRQMKLSDTKHNVMLEYDFSIYLVIEKHQ